MSEAAYKGHLAMVQHLHALQCPWDTCSTREAARGGHVDLLRWLIDNGCPWDNEMCTAAANGGKIVMLAHLQQQGLLTTAALLTDMLNAAARCNKPELAAAQWLREQGAEWPVTITPSRSYGWSDELLAWARAEGCTAPVS
jgi:hypothetical protein